VFTHARDQQHDAASYSRDPQHRRKRERSLSIRRRVHRTDVDHGLSTCVSDALIGERYQAEHDEEHTNDDDGSHDTPIMTRGLAMDVCTREQF
jgi:hypothetical protein